MKTLPIMSRIFHKICILHLYSQQNSVIRNNNQDAKLLDENVSENGGRKIFLRRLKM